MDPYMNAGIDYSPYMSSSTKSSEVFSADVQKMLGSIRIDDRENVSVPYDTLRDALFYRCSNNNTKMDDIVAFIPIESSEGYYNIYRRSSKHGNWCKIGGRHNLTLLPIGNPFVSHCSEYLKLQCKYLENIRSMRARFYKSDSNSNTQATCKKKEGASMFNLNKIFGRFGKASKGDFAMSVNGGTAIKRKDGSYACLVEGHLTNVDTFALDVDAFYYIPTAMSQIAVGDVVVTGVDGSVGFVTESGEASVKVYDINSEVIKTVHPAVHFLVKTPCVTKVVSLLSLGGDNSNPLMWMLFLGDDNKAGGMKDLLPMMLLCGGMNNGSTPFGGMNPMMMAMMMGGKMDGDSLLPFMLMGGMGGGNASLFGNLFGGGNVSGNAKCKCGCAAHNNAPQAAEPPVAG